MYKNMKGLTSNSSIQTAASTIGILLIQEPLDFEDGQDSVDGQQQCDCGSPG